MAEFRLYLNDALYNAGILGFIRICKSNSLPISCKGNCITFDQENFNDFSKAYLQTMVTYFREDTIYEEIRRRYGYLVTLKIVNNDDEKKADENIKYILDKLKRASYSAAFEIIRERGENYDFSNVAKELKIEKDYVKKIEIFANLIEKMKQYQDVFLLKDIAYTKIQPFWTNMAFLNAKKNKAEFEECFTETFSKPAVEFIVKEKNAKLNCCQCNVPITKSEACAMAWVNDLGVDVARKTSYFWDFNVDSFLCPTCNLIYACIPLGFTMKGSEGIFVNDNESIRRLEGMNSIASAKMIGRKDDVFYQVLERFQQIKQEISVQQEINNIQVVRRSEGKYVFNILSKESLKKLETCENDLKRLVGINFKVQENYINVYRSVLREILNGGNLYSLIHSILHEGISNGLKVWFVQSLMKIQAISFKKEDGNMTEKIVFPAMKRGEELRAIMMSSRQNENKVRTISYRLLNALKVRNSAEFMDTLLRSYIGLGKEMPKGLIDVLKSEEQFLNFGYAFVAGLNGASEKKNENMEDGKNEQGINN